MILGRLYYNEAPFVFTHRMLDASFHLLEIERILRIGSASVTYGNARLAETPNSFFNQRLVPGMERLVATDEKSCRFTAIEDGANSRGDPICPVFSRALSDNTNILVDRRLKQVVSVVETAGLKSIEPHDEWLTICTKSCTRLRRGTDEVGHRDITGGDYSIAKPPHSTCLFNTIGYCKPEILIYALPHFVGVEMNGTQSCDSLPRQRRLASSRQPHQKQFTIHGYP